MNRNKDHDSYIKYISVIDLIIKNSDEKIQITINQIQRFDLLIKAMILK